MGMMRIVHPELPHSEAITAALHPSAGPALAIRGDAVCHEDGVSNRSAFHGLDKHLEFLIRPERHCTGAFLPMFSALWRESSLDP